MCTGAAGLRVTRDVIALSTFSSRLQTYTELLSYTRSAVTRNASEKSINGILDYVSAAQDLDTALMQRWYEVTQQALEEAKNEVRRWGSTLAESRFLTERFGLCVLSAAEREDKPQARKALARSQGVYTAQQGISLPRCWTMATDADQSLSMTQLIRELHASIGRSAGSTSVEDGVEADNSKGTLLLEILALEIQMYTDVKNNKKLRVRCRPMKHVQLDKQALICAIEDRRRSTIRR